MICCLLGLIIGGFDIVPYYFEFWEGMNTELISGQFLKLKERSGKNTF